jgi:dethiobiotin synthetase
VGRILFITGTGTGVGKTVLTALLLRHLQEQGENALAMKPFCSGSRSDARLLHRLQSRDLGLEETNPYFFRLPLAPWVAARQMALPQVPFKAVLQKTKNLANRTKTLLIEGSGGLLAPLGDNYAAAELIAALDCESVVVAPNFLGTINHTLLTVKYLQSIDAKGVRIVVMGVEKADQSSRSNVDAIRQLAGGIPVISVPFLGSGASKLTNLKQNAKKMKKTLAQVLGGANVVPFLPTGKSDCSTKSVDNWALKR